MLAGMNESAESPDALVRQGYAAQQQGDLARARQAYERALQRAPAHPDALQLLGAVLRRLGDVAGAEQRLRQSLAAREAQPHVWNNLGNLLLAEGRRDEALAAYERALGLAPSLADAHYNRARALHAAGRLQEAAASLERALACAPRPTVAMLQLQAQIEGDGGRLDTALDTLDRAIAAEPGRAALWHNRAVLLQRSHRFAQALQAHDRAAALGVDAADAHYNRGNTLQSLGRHTEALAAYRTALARQPGHGLALYDLARLRWRMGDPDFDQELLQAIATRPDDAQAASVRAQLLWSAGRLEDAEQAYALAAARAPRSAPVLDGLARCRVRRGRLEDGLALHRQAVALAPQDVELRANLAASLLVAGRFEAAQEAAEAACRIGPQHQHAQALRGLAWRMLDDPRAAWLDDAARFVRVYDLPPPEGFADMQSFNDALAAELDALHGDRQAPIDQTLRGGTQTVGDIFEQGHPHVNLLKARIAQAVDDYLQQLPTDPTHPFLSRRTAAWRFTDSWSSRLSRQGFHTDHVHPHGWVSSAYYVRVPGQVADTTRRRGWIQFGRPDLPLPGRSGDALVRRTERPVPGRLVLFPSMMWHGTTPFDDDAVRMTIAFDLVPA
jgi:tetratricopeptide (TPR) repeat protein